MNKIDFNQDWQFVLEDDLYFHLMEQDDTHWKTVKTPHDWSVEFDFNEEKGEGCTGYLLGGIGWYRKHFTTSEAMAAGLANIVFDGIYNRSDIYVNEQHVGFFPYGYVPINVDLTDYLNPVGEDNVIAIRVDHSRYADSRWYTGSGIYRKVALYVSPKVHVPVWGTFVTTPNVTKEEASVQVEVTVKHCGDAAELATVRTTIVDPDGKVVKVSTKNTSLSVGTSKNITFNETIDTPQLWEIFDGKQYKAVVEVIEGDQVTQTVETKFGVRFFHFDADKGFFFNGKNTLIKGVCLHHDCGLVGSAVPKAVWRDRLNTFKACGVNAIRSAHNPTSEVFLELCDEMGILVQEEFYDEWDNPKDKRSNRYEQFVDYITRGHHEYFQEYAKQDLQTVVMRDRNHPSIFQYSIGNEIEWTYRKILDATGYFSAHSNGNYFWTEPPYSTEEIRERMAKIKKDKYELRTTAKNLRDWTKELDTTRPVIANCILPTASLEAGYADALDMVGFSYRQVIYDRAHESYPDLPIMGTENVGQWHEWKAVLDRDFVSGIFLWTGMDYMGEAGVKGRTFPLKASPAGIINLGGIPKPSYHMFKSLWQEEPVVHIETQTLEASLYDLADGTLVEKEGERWDRRLWKWQDVNPYWNYSEGQMVAVEIYTNCEEVTLYLDDENLGSKSLADFEDHIIKWALPYKAGSLKAVGTMNGATVEDVIESASKPVTLELTANKITEEDNETVHFVTAQLLDQAGNPVKHSEEKVVFEVEGDYKLLGTDNGSPRNVESYQNYEITTNHGQCLLLLEADQASDLLVTAKMIGYQTKISL